MAAHDDSSPATSPDYYTLIATEAEVDEIIHRIRRYTSNHCDLTGPVADALEHLAHTTEHTAAVVQDATGAAAIRGSLL
jgi:hypothetical protein